ncbi:hypothetical protein WMY93_022808 [Mugilogobius chulae]|uniref:Uncharacterized protein n=1 Tax=Mugilogobius chulae TaxID=88201 RepID=A0AAW0N7Z5_9GOBI
MAFCFKGEMSQPPQIKEEPEEQNVKQEEEPLPLCVSKTEQLKEESEEHSVKQELSVSVPDFRVVCVKTEDSSLLQEGNVSPKRNN